MDKYINDFRPALASIVRRPPSPLGRIFPVGMAIIILMAIFSSLWIDVDRIATAPGKVISLTRPMTIQSTETARLQKIWVADGDKVRQGQVVVTLDDTNEQASLKNVADEHFRLKNYLSVLETYYQAVSSGSTLPDLQPRDPYVIAKKNYWLDNFHDSLLKQARSERILEMKTKEKLATEKSLLQLVALLGISKEKYHMQEALYKRSVLNKLELLNTKEAQVKMHFDVSTYETKITALDSEIQITEQELKQTRQRFLLSISKEKADILEQLEDTQSQIDLLHAQIANKVLRAPQDGQIVDLQIPSAGSVVVEGYPLMVIIPDDGKLRIEAWISNKDRGHIQVAQNVSLKVDSYPFIEYGTVAGEIESISADSINHGQQGYLYRMIISLTQNHLDHFDQTLPIKSGMLVQADIHIGKRTLFAYFANPIRSSMDSAMNEY